MDINDSWNSIDWQTSEFSFAKDDLLTQLKSQSKNAISRLLKAYWRLYFFSLAFTVITPLAILLKPQEPEFVFSVGLIAVYWVVLSGFLTVKFARFKLPDLSARPADAIRETLTLVRSINAFQVNFLVFFMPFVFLGSMLASLTYGGTRIHELLANWVILAIIGLSTLGVLAISLRFRRYLVNRKCMALIEKLEANLQQVKTA
ncbi:hypothetical protein [Spirosoma areae]